MTLSEDLEVSVDNAKKLEENSLVDFQTIVSLTAENDALKARLDVYEPAPVPLLAGLLSRSRANPALSGWNIEVSWADAEPSPGVYDFSKIETALAQDPRARLRLNAGIQCPDWLKQMTGGGVLVTNAQDGRTGTMARYWGQYGYQFWNAYENLQEELAKTFDGRLYANFMTGTMVIYAEPFLRQLAEPSTRQNLLNAGWDEVDDKIAQYKMLSLHAPWKKTRTGIAVNPLQTLDGQDMAWTRNFLDNFRLDYRDLALVGNNSIREAFIGGETKPGNLYQHLKQVGPPLYFQTSTWDKIAKTAKAATPAERHDALCKTIEWAISMGAHAVELPQGHNLFPGEIATYDTQLKANA